MALVEQPARKFLLCLFANPELLLRTLRVEPSMPALRMDTTTIPSAKVWCRLRFQILAAIAAPKMQLFAIPYIEFGFRRALDTSS